MEDLETLYQVLQNNFKKENNKLNRKPLLYKYQAYIITPYDEEDNFKNLKNILLDDTVVFYQDNLWIWKGKLIKFENIEDNSLALVGNNIWTWKKDKWYKTDAKSKYDNIRQLCEFNNLDLKDLTLDSLDCIYRKDYGCESKLYVRLKDNILKIDDTLQKFKKYIDNVKNNIALHEITQNIENIKNKYYSSIFYKNYQIEVDNYYENTKEIKNNDKKEIITDNLDILLSFIYKIENDYTRRNYIYNLIEKDGILIDNKIYSKKYKKIIDICSHYYYFKKIDYADSPEEKIILTDEMISLFSDNGETEKDYHCCKLCGEFLLNTEYDETEGFNSNGMIKKSRTTWVIEKIYEKEYNDNIDLINYIEKIQLENHSFKKLLLKYGLSIEDVDQALSTLTFIVKNLFPKVGVILPNNEILTVIIDCMQKIKNILPYSIYKIKEIKKLQDKGFSKEKITNIDNKNTFKIGYERFFAIKRCSIIISRYLISIQTAIPSIMRSSKLTICPFYSFDNDEGITYMTCILQEMKIILLKDETKTMDILKSSISESYNDFKNIPYIKELFQQKKIYDLELKKKEDQINNINNTHNNESIFIVDQLSNNYEKTIKKTKNITILHQLKNNLIQRMNYLAKKIKENVKIVIANSPLSNTYSTLVEASCCTEDADKYIDYYYYIAIEAKEPINDYIQEANSIYKFNKYFMNFGSIHKYLLYDKNYFNGIYNPIIVDNEKNTSENIIKKVFELFVDDGIYKGTMREYVGNDENKIDIKSGITKKAIISKTYTIEEYQTLLQDIEKLNTKYYKPQKTYDLEPSILNTLKKNSIDILDEEITNLIKNIANRLNKDKNFIDKYINLLRNLGIFEKKKNEDIINNHIDKIKYREYVNKKRLHYLKEFYITKFRKYLSIIKNGNNKINVDINLSFIESEEIGLEIQSDIYNENKKLFPFLVEDIKIYFMNITLDYSNEVINSINGMDDIYNSSYETIKKYSDFNFNDASNVILYIIVSQLNKFMNNQDDFDQDIKYKNISLFILLLLETLDEDNELFTNCIDGSNLIKNSLIHDYIEYKNKVYFKEDEDYITKTMKNILYTKSNAVGDLDQLNDIADQENDEEKKMENENDYIMKKGKEYYMDKFGYNPTDDQLETYKTDYLQNYYEDKIIEEEIYDLDNTPKGQDVIDQGTDYGGFNDYDFETGNGFDYSEEIYE